MDDGSKSSFSHQNYKRRVKWRVANWPAVLRLGAGLTGDLVWLF